MLIDLVKSSRLKGSVNDTYALLQYARSDALRKGEDRYVVWDQNGDKWCAAVAINADCNCLSEDCSIDGVLRQINSDDYSGVTLVASGMGSTRFDGLRGLAGGGNGTVRYQLLDGGTTEAEVRVVVSVLGRVHYCKETGSVGDYPECE
ncbi:GspH/FimT family protein [Pseudidiomarina halophila]|nr:GspH/FimT family protein [Pseudidiomarina halophila]